MLILECELLDQQFLPNMTSRLKEDQHISRPRVMEGGNLGQALEIEKLTHILPSYYLDQSLFGRKQHAEIFDIVDHDIASPIYTTDDQSDISSTVTTMSSILYNLLDIPGFKHDTIMHNLTSLPYLGNSTVSVEISLKLPIKDVYTNLDCLEGTLKITNNTDTALPFEMLIVTLEGRMSISKGIIDGKYKYKRKVFLNSVDMSSSFTEAEDSLNKDAKLPLPSNKKLAPRGVYHKKFFFKIPESKPDGDNGNQPHSNLFMASNSILPPSLGIVDYLYPIDPRKKIAISGCGRSNKLNDLTDLSRGISYSINARLITKNEEKYHISAHCEKLFKFIPNLTQRDSIVSLSLHPTQQLKLLMRLVERKFERAVNGKNDESETGASVSSSDPEKQQNMFRSSSLTATITDASKISFDESPFFEKELILEGKTRKQIIGRSLVPRTSPQFLSQGKLKLLAPSLSDNFKFSFDIKSANVIDLNFEVQYQPPVIENISNSKLHLLINNPTELLPINSSTIKTTFVVTKVETSADSFPIDLDLSWFLNDNTFNKSLKEPISNVLQLKKRMPSCSRVSLSVVTNVNSLISISRPKKHFFKDALISQVQSESSWLVDNRFEDLTFTKKVKLTLRFNPNFTKEYAMVPNYQILNMARFYSIRINLILPGQFQNLFKFESKEDIMGSPILLDIPVQISYS